jgi:uncharacterized Tic20 family protein
VGFFFITIKDKTNISLTFNILHLRQGSFTRKARTNFTLKIIVSMFVKLFMILVLHFLVNTAIQYKYGPYMGEEAIMGLFSSGFNSLFHFKGSISVISDNNIWHLKLINFTLKIIVSMFVKLFMILVLHLRQCFIVRIFVKRATDWSSCSDPSTWTSCCSFRCSPSKHLSSKMR